MCGSPHAYCIRFDATIDYVRSRTENRSRPKLIVCSVWRLNSVVEGGLPALRTRESKNQLFPTNHDPAANPKAPAPDSLQRVT